MSKRIEMDDIRSQGVTGAEELRTDSLLGTNMEMAAKNILSRCDGVEAVQILVVDGKGQRLTHTRIRPGSQVNITDPAPAAPNPELMPKTSVGEPSVGND